MDNVNNPETSQPEIERNRHRFAESMRAMMGVILKRFTPKDSRVAPVSNESQFADNLDPGRVFNETLGVKSEKVSPDTTEIEF